MQRIALVTVIAAMLPFSAFASDLTTIQSIYIAAEPRDRLEVIKILKAEVPALRISDRISEADAVLAFKMGFNAPPFRPVMPPTGTVVKARAVSSSSAADWGRTGDSRGTFMVLGHSTSFLRMRDAKEVTVIHSGLTSPFFVSHTARALAAIAKR